MLDDAATLISRNQWPVFQVTADERKAPLVDKGESWKLPKYHVEPTRERLQAARKGKVLLAAVMPPDTFVVDIDKKGALAPLCDAVNLNLLETTLAIRTGAGYHLWYLHNEKRLPIRSLKKKVDLFHDIDLRRNGYMIVPPSLHWTKKRHYKRIPNAFWKPQKPPKPLVKLLKRLYLEALDNKEYLTERDVKQMADAEPGQQYLSLDDLETALDALPPTNYCDKESFFKLLAAVHNTMGGSKAARELFITWARTDSTYNDKKSIAANRRMWNACK